MAVKDKHPHYHKNVAHLENIDVYRVLERFNVKSPTLQHAIKKLLVAGGRGAGKDQNQDVNEAIDSLNRFLEMEQEDNLEVEQVFERAALLRKVQQSKPKADPARIARRAPARPKPRARRGR